MKPANSDYLTNSLVHKNRRVASSASEWVAGFSCEYLRPLIICRGPVRKEAMDVFDEMGILNYGILLSEKDSITYPAALAPELRKLTDPDRLHRVPDYSGTSREERQQRIEQIIAIANENTYNAIFAGYGFMAEDEALVSAIESAGLVFIGPCSTTVKRAGQKDEAKRTALDVEVSVTPGVDNLSTLTLLKSYPSETELKQLCRKQKLKVSALVWQAANGIQRKADAVLEAGYKKGVDLVTVDQLSNELELQIRMLFRENPGSRIRLKAIGGGGGKGQRILANPSSFKGSKQQQISLAVKRAPLMYREILAEVKSNATGDNKNVLLELNIESTRHMEIQVVGNGDWCVTLGGRDCSLQMHEQKLIEISVTVEELSKAIETASVAGRKAEVSTLRAELLSLQSMEEEAVRFGEAVGLDSVSTFECIVEKKRHFFMEMNTRVQVEHRVSELCYGLYFVNPDDNSESIRVDSILELMVLLACHGSRLPRPERYVRENNSVEVRLNATDAALQPHAGGIITSWSNVVAGEIRDDQGISLHNPDTDVFMKYHVSGAYDSNIALLLTTGESRSETLQRMAEILRRTRISGVNLDTNHHFHYGLVSWFLGNGANARPTTAFIAPYLAAVGLLKQCADKLDVEYAFNSVLGGILASVKDSKTLASAIQHVVERKRSLLQRPIQKLLQQPHLLSGWLAQHRSDVLVQGKMVIWLRNPIDVMAETYHFLDMDYSEGDPALHQIWDHDRVLLLDAVDFYKHLKEKLGVDNWQPLQKILETQKAPKGFSANFWKKTLAAHSAYQLGMDVLLLLPYCGIKSGFYNLGVNADLSIKRPKRLQETELQKSMQKILAPPPTARTDEIVAVSGGMFYSREAPEAEAFVCQGQHFEQGDPLYLVEVMKMFNTVYASFAGTVDEVLLDTDGVIIKKGQVLFKVTPDEVLTLVSEEDRMNSIRVGTQSFLDQLA